MVFRIPRDRHSSAVRSYHIALRDRVLGVVSALRVNVRLEFQKQFGNCRLVKNRDEVDRLERRDDLSALFGLTP